MKRRLIVGFLIAVIALTIAVPVLAYLYRAPLTIASNYTDYTALPVTCMADVDWMIDNGFITTSTALDTRVETLGGTAQKHMMAEDRIMVFCPTLPGYSQLNWYLTTGNAPLASFPVIVGYGGCVSVTDHANLELDNDFEVEVDGYLADGMSYPCVMGNNASTEDLVTTTHTVDLPNGTVSGDLIIVVFACYYTGGGTPVITWPATWTQLDKVEAANYARGVIYKVASGTEGGSITVTTSLNVWSAHQSLKVVDYQGVPEISAVVTAASANPDSASLTPSWGANEDTLWLTVFGGGVNAVRTISSYPANYGDGQFTASSAGYAYAGSARRLLAAASEDPGQFTLSDVIGWSAWTIGVRGQALGQRPIVHKDNAFLFSVNSGNLTGRMYNGPTVAYSLTDGAYEASLWADTADFGLDVDGSNEDTTALGGASVPDNASNWTISTPYFNSYAHTTSSNLRITYEPDDLISGTTLVNETNPGTHNGNITWGTNPSGVTAVLGALTVPETTVSVVEEAGGYQGAMHEVGVTDWFTEPDVGTRLAASPIRPLVTLMSDYTTITEVQSWRFLGLAILLLITVVAAVMLRGHLLIAGLACGGTIAVLVQQTIWPAWTLVFIIPAIIAGVMAERTPSIG